MRWLWPFAGLALAASRLWAQADAPHMQPADFITAADIARHIGVIAADSMRGRATPSPGLEKTARYVADQFKALGLEPAGDSGTWFQRFPAGDLTLDYGKSNLELFTKVVRQGKQVVSEEDYPLMRHVKPAWGTDLAVASDTLLDSRAPGAQDGGQAFAVDFFQLAGAPEFLVAGPQTATSLQQANLHEKVVLYLPPAGTSPKDQRQVVDILRGAGNNVVVVVDDDSASFAQRYAAAVRKPPVVPEVAAAASQKPIWWAVYVRQAAIRGALVSAGVDLDEVRASSTPVVRQAGTLIALQIQGQPAESSATAPNTIGLLRAENPKQGILVFTAHMDQIHGRDDGADDNASGVAGLIALAKAFRQAGAPQRSIVFAAVSGTKDARGSTTLATYLAREYRAAININLDMIGRKAGDSIRVAGFRDATFPTQPDWVATQHPELGLTVVDTGTVSVPASDHFAFVRKAMPSLYFHNGSHDDATATAPRALDADLEARILRLVFYVAQDIATGDQFPEWTREGRRQWLDALQGSP